MKSSTIEIAGLNINNVTSAELLSLTEEKISLNEKTLITYANANTINLIYNNDKLKKLLNSFDIIHSDGVGIFLGARFLFGSKGFEERLTGSDSYPLLAKKAMSNNWKIFFFGHDNDTLNKIKNAYPALNICGIQNGYNYIDEEVISLINSAAPDIIIIGLSQPKQEEWLYNNKEKLNFKVCFCVGDGIKIFAGIKTRGPKFMQAIGMEWFVRLLASPLKYFKRYVLGNPLFLYRIIILKMRKFTR